MFEGTLGALNYMYSINVPHNCLKASHVYIGHNSVYKIADPDLFGYSNDFNTVFNERDEIHEGVFLSPA